MMGKWFQFLRDASSALLMAIFLSLATGTAFARIHRSHTAVNDFKRANPCPVNGARRGSCPGWEVDHVIALCAGGPDIPQNMQWLSRSAHRQKTKRDVMLCRVHKTKF